MASGRPNPGWFPDPEQAARYRWWDGRRWTDAIDQPYPTPPPEARPQFAEVESKPLASQARAQGAGLLIMAGAVVAVVSLALPWATAPANIDAFDRSLPWAVSDGGWSDAWLLLGIAGMLIFLGAVTVGGLAVPAVRLATVVFALMAVAFGIVEWFALDDGGVSPGIGPSIAVVGGIAAFFGGLAAHEQ